MGAEEFTPDYVNDVINVEFRSLTRAYVFVWIKL